MARDIEDFLRKAAERRKQAQGSGAAQPPPRSAPPSAPPPRPAQPKGQQPVRPLAPSVQQRPVAPASVEAELVRRGATVADHVRAHISTNEISEQVRRLGEEVGLADDKLEQRLHDKFDHNVGDLQRKKGSDSVQAEVSPADWLLAMLQDPKSVRQAIILSEILRRPDF